MERTKFVSQDTFDRQERLAKQPTTGERMTLEQVWTQLRELARRYRSSGAADLYKLQGDHIDAGNGLKITLEPEGVLSLWYEGSRHSGYSIQCMHELIKDICAADRRESLGRWA